MIQNSDFDCWIPLVLLLQQLLCVGLLLGVGLLLCVGLLCVGLLLMLLAACWRMTRDI